MGGGGGYTLCEGGYTINLSYGWVVEEVILPVEEVIHPAQWESLGVDPTKSLN